MDASVIVKFVLPEPDGERALQLLDGALAGEWVLLGPDLWRTEVANAVWKRTRRSGGRLDALAAADVLAWSARLPIHTVPGARVLAAAFELALETGITVYDALYVALAVRDRAALVTADGRLVDQLGTHPVRTAVLHLSEL